MKWISLVMVASMLGLVVFNAYRIYLIGWPSDEALRHVASIACCIGSAGIFWELR